MKKIDKTGIISGRLTVIKEAGKKISGGKYRIYWLCKCDCGNEIELVSEGIGRTLSCGCLHKESTASINYKHGEAGKTKENKTWFGIKDRCYNKNAEKYGRYGGRGVIVCDRWLNSYEDFLSDMGRAPTNKHSIDRIDNNGNYEPGNCKWSTDKQQSNNKSTNVLLTYKNVTLNLKQWSEKLGYEYKYFHAQLKNKSLEELSHGEF